MSKILDDFEFSYLRKLQATGLNAIIAGGSVRDMIKKVPYKDVDIYIQINEKMNPCRFFDEEVQDIFGTDFDIKNNGMFDASFNPRTPTHMIGNGDIEGNKFQLIIVNANFKNMINKQFDLNCCRCWHDGTELHTSKDFKYFLETNEIDTNHAVNQITGRTLSRAKDFAARFGSTFGTRLKEAFEYYEKRTKNVVSWNYITSTGVVPAQHLQEAQAHLNEHANLVGHVNIQTDQDQLDALTEE